MLVGLLEAVGDQIYNVKVTPEVLEVNKLKTGIVKEHVTFLLHFHEEDGSLRRKVSVVTPPEASRKVSTLSSQMLIDVDSFCDIFPYHVLFNSSLRILQSGYKLQILSGKSWLSLKLNVVLAVTCRQSKHTAAHVLPRQKMSPQVLPRQQMPKATFSQPYMCQKKLIDT